MKDTQNQGEPYGKQGTLWGITPSKWIYIAQIKQDKSIQAHAQTNSNMKMDTF